jgi:ABC-type molybdenum transport system ATPase subunit/photorepair protein PhrA
MFAATDPAASGAPLIELAGAVAVLGRFPALSGLDLTVDPGEIVLLRGPNGAGKTTRRCGCVPGGWR